MEGQSLSKLFDEIFKLDSSEIIVGSNEVRNLLVKGNSHITYTVSEETNFCINEANYLIKIFPDYKPRRNRTENLNNATRSLGGLLNYLGKINPSNLDMILL